MADATELYHPAKDDATEHDGEDQDRGVIVNASDLTADMLPRKKKKSKSKRPGSKRGLGKPTGFEGFYADAPLTAEEVAESREAFDSRIPFVDRILKAIQRFERTRKLSNERSDVFYKYLAYGGISIGPNMFSGGQSTEDMDKDEITASLAQTSISEDTRQNLLQHEETGNERTTTTADAYEETTNEHRPKYAVDFEGTMRAFLSRRASVIYVLETQEDVGLVTTTLERFMDYLLQHDVCPEYGSDIIASRNLCRAAKTELWHCVQAQKEIPGSFNIACSTLFGGYYSEHHAHDSAWAPSGPNDKSVTPERATQIVGFAIAGAATEKVYEKYLAITSGQSAGQSFEVVQTTRGHGFEITNITSPSQECLALYQENTADFEPIGIVHAKHFHNPDAPPENLTEVEKQALQSTSTSCICTNTTKAEDEYVFFIESSPLLPLLQIGTRIEATIYKLNCDVWFFDEVRRVLPSFDLWIENELMLGWKEPKWIPGVGAVEYTDPEVDDFPIPEHSNRTTHDGELEAETNKSEEQMEELHDVTVQEDMSTPEINGADQPEDNIDDLHDGQPY